MQSTATSLFITMCSVCKHRTITSLGCMSIWNCKIKANKITLLHFIIWLAPRAGKMTQITRCDWLPEQARWSHLVCLELPAVSHKQNFPKSHIINPLLTKFAQSRWLDIGLVLFLWVSINMQIQNLANIQPSCLHIWSITHAYFTTNKLIKRRLSHLKSLTEVSNSKSKMISLSLTLV